MASRPADDFHCMFAVGTLCNPANFGMTVPTGEVRIMSDLSQAINKLRSLSPQLNAAVIEADRVVSLVERFLVQECGLGVEAEVPLHYNDKGKAVTLLRYASFNGTFRIAVTHTDGSTHFVTRPWSECDRNQ